MAKTTDNQEQMEQAIRSRINASAQEMANKIQAKASEAIQKATEAAQKKRKAMLAREVAKCFLTCAAVAGLYAAQAADLISTVLTHPLYAIAFVCFGWHLCKLRMFGGRK